MRNHGRYDMDKVETDELNAFEVTRGSVRAKVNLRPILRHRGTAVSWTAATVEGISLPNSVIPEPTRAHDPGRLAARALFIGPRHLYR